ncbi:hypothetical protein ABZV67_24765 [Streptomyces sp. NPDC005065]|uniref:hypothetical protein n=1 Tax=unclassified Streptomyces TaxID=2593676 RepID=UPI0033B11EC1
MSLPAGPAPGQGLGWSRPDLQARPRGRRNRKYLYANANRYPWTPSHDRRPVVEAPTNITFAGYENPPGLTTDQRVQNLLGSERADRYNHVHFTAHHDGGHFIPWEIPDGRVADLRRTFRSRR